MATYFPRSSRRTEQQRDALEEQESETRQRERRAPSETDAMAATSILVFPSPSSTPPSPTPSTVSQLSIPTSVSIDWSSSAGGARSSGRRTVSFQSMSSGSPSGSRSLWEELNLDALQVELLEGASEVGSSSAEVEVWEWSSAATSDGNKLKSLILKTRDPPSSAFVTGKYDNEVLDSVQARLVARHRTRTISQFSNNSITSNGTTGSQRDPHTPIHIPFISFVQSLLGVDPQTIFLLTHSASEDSSLFVSSPFDIVSPDTVTSDSDDAISTLRRVPGSDTIALTNILRRGLRASSQLNVIPPATFGVINPIFELIGYVMGSSRKALRGLFVDVRTPAVIVA
jgi:hypothetical protein